jgi:hypothetical protein
MPMNPIKFEPREKPAPQPLRRDPPTPPGNAFVRLIVAHAQAQLTKRPIEEIIERNWPADRTVIRAAANPAMTTVAGWAAELAQTIVSAQLEALGPASAGAQVLQEGLVLTFDGAGHILAPGFVAEFGNAGFVAEGAAIPVRQLLDTSKTLDPHKLSAIAVLTREMINGSNAEAIIADTLIRAAGRMLDEVLFDANPGDAARPAGLRNGIAALTASNNADLYEAFSEDIVALVNALAPVGGAGPYLLVTSPGRAVAINIRFARELENVRVIGSSAIVNDVLAIAPAALVAALSPDPVIETANASTLIMDTAPGAIGTPSAPHRSLFQTDSIALKLRWPITWALRDARGFAWITPVWKGA